jgi:CRP-like cAMP-binding protein
MHSTLPRPANLLLQAMSDGDFALIEPHLERVPLRADHVICPANQPIREFCFLEGGVASFHDILSDGSRVGLGIIGYEGLTGWPALLGTEISPHEATVAIARGTALRLPVGRLHEARARSADLNDLLLRFVHAFIRQMGRTIVSNLTDPIERRLSRWLLMNQDRLQTDDIELTHKQIGVMLGVRRASVTDAVHLLEGQGLIKSTRGHILIRDREGLERLTGESYGAAEAEYSRLIAAFPQGAAPRSFVGNSTTPPDA